MEQRLVTGSCLKSCGGAAAGNRLLEKPPSLACPLCDYFASDASRLEVHVRMHFEPSSSLWLPRVLFMPTYLPTPFLMEGAMPVAGAPVAKRHAVGTGMVMDAQSEKLMKSTTKAV
eukprot:9492507-Pyramimonas_sp.AAC.1